MTEKRERDGKKGRQVSFSFFRRLEVEKKKREKNTKLNKHAIYPGRPFRLSFPPLFLSLPWEREIRRGEGKSFSGIDYAVPVTRARTEPRASLRARAANVLRPI